MGSTVGIGVCILAGSIFVLGGAGGASYILLKEFGQSSEDSPKQVPSEPSDKALNQVSSEDSSANLEETSTETPKEVPEEVWEEFLESIDNPDSAHIQFNGLGGAITLDKKN